MRCQILADLHERIQRNHRFTPPLENTAFEYGFNTGLMKKVVEHWANGYDWRAQESYMNTFPHFKTKMAGLDIHFIHVKPSDTSKPVLPLLLLHGWPGSFVEFLKIIPLLTQEREGYDFTFEVIVPSLPGYGFSEGARKPGLGPPEMGHIFNNLMKRLGFNRYYVQGGDWGSIIATSMATLYPERYIEYCLNYWRWRIISKISLVSVLKDCT